MDSPLMDVRRSHPEGMAILQPRVGLALARPTLGKKREAPTLKGLNQIVDGADSIQPFQGRSLSVFTQGRSRRRGLNPGLKDRNPVGVAADNRFRVNRP